VKTSTLKEIKDELQNCSQDELLTLSLRLIKYKKENKELVSYLLHESFDDAVYIDDVKSEIDTQFKLINKKTAHIIKKGVRKILAQVKKYIRYSQKKETEIALLLHFCLQLKHFKTAMARNKVLYNTFHSQIAMVKKAILTLDEDLQYDYNRELEDLLEVDL
jgi:hypothetical protein